MKTRRLHAAGVGLLCVGLLLAAPAWALDPADFVVKLTSISHALVSTFEGSGILVQDQQKVYVLTSEHVVLHDNDGTTHTFQLDGQAPQVMSYRTSDWGYGLALLETQLAPTAQIPALEELAKTPPPQAGQAAYSMGFPLHTTSLLADTDGHVASTTTSSDILADVEFMLEIQGAHGEFGMSGGAVTKDDASLIGILSHEKPDPTNKVLYAIPIAPAARWALEFTRDKSALPRLVRTSLDLVTRAGNFVRNAHLIAEWRSDGASVGYDNNRQERGINPPTRSLNSRFWDALGARIDGMFGGKQDPGYYPRCDITFFRAVDLAAFRKTTKAKNLVGFFRLLKDPSLRPIAPFDYQGAPGYSFDGDYLRVAQALAALPDIYEQPLHAHLAAIRELAGTAMDGHGFYYVTYSYAWLNVDDIATVLDSALFAANWASFKKSDPLDYEKWRETLKKMMAMLPTKSI